MITRKYFYTCIGILMIMISCSDDGLAPPTNIVFDAPTTCTTVAPTSYYESPPTTKAALSNAITVEIAKGDNANFNMIDTSEITDMSGLFKNKISFNGKICHWNTSKVTNMNEMFLGASNFNGIISKWDVSNVTSMNRMFYNAETFNGNIGS